MSGDYFSRVNGSFLCPSQRTGQNRRCTGQMSGAFTSRAPEQTESSSPPDRASPDRSTVRCSVRCSVRCVLHSTSRLGLATGHLGRVTGHVRCTPRPIVRCNTSLCFARANSHPRAPEHRTEATGQNLLSGALSGASPRPVSTPFLNAFSFYLPHTMCISNVHVC
jgi:hypothetical protein